ncbi:hypothetical protein Dimus_023347 [Dionaea muscipula]
MPGKKFLLPFVFLRVVRLAPPWALQPLFALSSVWLWVLGSVWLWDLFTGLCLQLKVTSAGHARNGFPVNGKEVMAIATLLQFVDALQININTAVKDS